MWTTELLSASEHDGGDSCVRGQAASEGASQAIAVWRRGATAKQPSRCARAASSVVVASSRICDGAPPALEPRKWSWWGCGGWDGWSCEREVQRHWRGCARGKLLRTEAPFVAKARLSWRTIDAEAYMARQAQWCPVAMGDAGTGLGLAASPGLLGVRRWVPRLRSAVVPGGGYRAPALSRRPGIVYARAATVGRARPSWRPGRVRPAQHLAVTRKAKGREGKRKGPRTQPAADLIPRCGLRRSTRRGLCTPGGAEREASRAIRR